MLQLVMWSLLVMLQLVMWSLLVMLHRGAVANQG
jgi:hypothetical protein